MNEIVVTVIGNVASDLRFEQLKSGTPLATFRLASSARIYDRGKGEWTDGPTSFFSVFCWNSLGEHVASSLSKGEPVVVTGRLTSRSWERDGRSGTSLEIRANSVGHDLSRGTASFQRRSRTPRTDDTAAKLDEIGIALATSPSDASAPQPAGQPASAAAKAPAGGQAA